MGSSRITRKDVEERLKCELFENMGAYLTYRNGYCAIDMENGHKTLIIGSLRECYEYLGAYSEGYYHAINLIKKQAQKVAPFPIQ